MKRVFILRNGDIAAKARAAILSAPLGYRVTIEEPKRTLAQNAIMWDLLEDFAKQVTHSNGKKYPADAWKMAFMHELGIEAKFMPSLDGSEVVPLGYRSSDLGEDDMWKMIEKIEAEGAMRGVIFERHKKQEAA